MANALIKAVPWSLDEFFESWEPGKYGRRSPRLVKVSEKQFFIQIPTETSIVQMCVEGSPFAWDRNTEKADGESHYEITPLIIDRLSGKLKNHPLTMLYPVELKQIEDESKSVLKRLNALMEVGLWEHAKSDAKAVERSMDVLAKRAGNEKDKEELLQQKVYCIEQETKAHLKQALEDGIGNVDFSELVHQSFKRIELSGLDPESGYVTKTKERLSDFLGQMNEKMNLKIWDIKFSEEPGKVAGKTLHLNPDLSPMLQSFPWVEGMIHVRVIHTRKGVEKVQRRLRGGLLEYFADADPLGQFPHGYEQTISHFQKLQRFREMDKEYGDAWLEHDGCDELWDDTELYQKRAGCFKVLKDWNRAGRDLEISRQSLQFIAKHAEDDDYRLEATEGLPKIISELTRMKAEEGFDERRYDKVFEAFIEAERMIDEVIRKNEFSEIDNDLEQERENFSKLQKEWSEKIPNRTPVARAWSLQRRLMEAVRKEDYERAAVLKKELDKIHWRKKGTAGQ